MVFAGGARQLPRHNGHGHDRQEHFNVFPWRKPARRSARKIAQLKVELKKDWPCLLLWGISSEFSGLKALPRIHCCRENDIGAL